MPDFDSARKRPWPFPAGARHRIVPEKRNVESPSTDHEHPTGDSGDTSGRNLEQQEAVKATP
jgi:hypothetical protein